MQEPDDFLQNGIHATATPSRTSARGCAPTTTLEKTWEGMAARGWSLNGLQHPPAVHLAVTLRLMSYAPETTALIPLVITETSKGNYTPVASQAP